MGTAMRSATAAALAATGMYLFDPISGRRRRSILRDRFVSAVACTADATCVAGRDLAHRAQGLAARTLSSLASGEASDEVLIERVRAALGRVVSHPGAIKVSSTRGRVVLTGAVLRHEHARLTDAVRAVRGVHDLEDQLAVHKSPNHISSLQGGRPRPTRNFALMQENWPPAARLLASAAGGTLVLWGMRERGLLGVMAAAAGGALIVRSTTNAPLERLAGASGRRAIDIHKTIHVEAPVEQVFATLSSYENFPAFMRNVRKVSVHEDGRSHWVVAGPAGASVEWDAKTTACVPNEVLAWRTVPNAMVAHAGIIRFLPEGASTRLDIHMTYNPPGGAVGHVVAKLFGADPKSELDEDMLRLKSYLETGVPAHDAAARRNGSAAQRLPQEGLQVSL